jgi:hypothetical protein
MPPPSGGRKTLTWRLSTSLRLVGLALYAIGLAVVWTLWGLLILVGSLLIETFRLVGVSLVGVERLVAAHRYSWRSALRVLPGRPAEKAQAGLTPAALQGEPGSGQPSTEASDV